MFVSKLSITTGSREMAKTKCERGGELMLSPETETPGKPQMERQTQDTLLLSDAHTSGCQQEGEGGGRREVGHFILTSYTCSQL